MSTHEIVYSRRFDRDFSAILRYIRTEASPLVADRIRDQIFDTIETLGDNPERYPPEPRLAHLGNYRVINMRKAPYKMFYRIAGTQIRMERIFHSKRDFMRIFRRFKF